VRELEHIIYLALGTNIGERLENLRESINRLAPQIRVLTESRIYETEPWGFADQPAFLNMAISAETNLSPRGLLDCLKELETRLGRVPNFRNGPRLIDVDILFYDDLILDTPGLVIPHPRLHERSFVLVPLLDIAPELVHPLLGRSVAQIASNAEKRGVNLYGV